MSNSSTRQHQNAREERRATVPATLTVRREGVGIELRRGPLEIALDGTTVGSLNRHDKIEMPIEPGHHTLQVNSGRYSSQSQPFDVADGQAITFRCHPAMVWPRYVASLFVPSLGISLKREQPR
jgi:hypothetical protein